MIPDQKFPQAYRQPAIVATGKTHARIRCRLARARAAHVDGRRCLLGRSRQWSIVGVIERPFQYGRDPALPLSRIRVRDTRYSSPRRPGRIDRSDRGHDPTGTGPRHHRDPVRQVDGLVDGMGHEDHRQIMFRGLAGSRRVLSLVRRHLVEGGEGLVHQQDPRSRHQTTGDGDAHLHGRPTIRADRRFSNRDKPTSTRAARNPVAFAAAARQPGKPKWQPDILEDRGPGHQGRLLEHETQIVLGVDLGGRDVDLPRGDRQKGRRSS